MLLFLLFLDLLCLDEALEELDEDLDEILRDPIVGADFMDWDD